MLLLTRRRQGASAQQLTRFPRALSFAWIGSNRMLQGSLARAQFRQQSQEIDYAAARLPDQQRHQLAGSQDGRFRLRAFPV